MISKIKSIKNFGVFKQFNGSALPEFKLFNLIYGWNYSGKTTLSRVVRCLEKGKLHDDYSGATFELENKTGKYDSSFAIKPNARVFNSDFIKENLKWDADNIEPIFVLGEENIELQKDLENGKAAYESLDKQLLEAKRVLKEKEDRSSAAITNKAREIGQLLSLRPFDARHFTLLVNNVKSAPVILSQAEFDKQKALALSTEQKLQISDVKLSISDLTVLKDETAKTLQRQAATGEKISKLLDNRLLSDWVETGKKLHEGKDICEFCGNTLSFDLAERLNQHFSKDFDLLKTEIQVILQKVVKAKIDLANLLPAEVHFYTDIQPDIRQIRPLLDNSVATYNAGIDSLLRDVKLKEERPFDKLPVSDVFNNKAELEELLSKVNVIIGRNNKRTADFTKEKNAAIENLKVHFASDFIKVEKYVAVQAEIEREKEAIGLLSTKMGDKKREIDTIKGQLDETIKGAVQVNEYLRVFFGKDDIQIETTSDKKFRLVRGTDVAKNLSEGEKTAISFAYFTAKLYEQNNKLEETIVYIDDPISSLDSNHLFNIFSFIKTTFYEMRKDPATDKNSHVFKCKQLFISTHNFEFYSLIQEWFSKTGNTNHAKFVIQRSKNAKKDESTLTESSKLIDRFKSDYAYLFSIIYDFRESPSDTFENLYQLPNIMRRFIETYLNFKHLATTNIEENIADLIKNPVECERARKFMHYYSHSLTTDRFMQFPNFAECINVVEIIVKSIEADDPVHFNALVRSVWGR